MRYFQFLSIFLVLFIGCQPATKTEPVDLTAVKEAITTQLDNSYEFLEARDLDALTTILSDNGLYCGTDLDKFWNKEQLLSFYAEMFANDSTVFKVSIDKREIRVNADGNSATCVEQYTWSSLSPKIPIRAISHFVKIGDDWKIDFMSWSLIPKNVDIRLFLSKTARFDST
jgi:ketosteroid isomerase-like protein